MLIGLEADDTCMRCQSTKNTLHTGTVKHMRVRRAFIFHRFHSSQVGDKIAVASRLLRALSPPYCLLYLNIKRGVDCSCSSASLCPRKNVFICVLQESDDVPCKQCVKAERGAQAPATTNHDQGASTVSRTETRATDYRNKRTTTDNRKCWLSILSTMMTWRWGLP